MVNSKEEPAADSDEDIDVDVDTDLEEEGEEFVAVTMMVI